MMIGDRLWFIAFYFGICLLHSIHAILQIFYSMNINYYNAPSALYLLNCSFVGMCYYDQTVFICRDWRWGLLREFCSKSSHIGEGCGLKLIWISYYRPQECQVCCRIGVIKRRIRKVEDRARRWNTEAARWKASIEVAEDDIRTFNSQLLQLEDRRPIRSNSLR